MDKLEEYLERARKERAMHERNGATGIVEAIDRIFPNLFDDKDERVRRELIDFIKDAKQALELQERDNNKWQIEQLEMYISWLEKQGEQNPNVIIPKFREGDKIRRKTLRPFDKDMQVARICNDHYICNHIGKFSSEPIPFSEESYYELVEQDPAWSEEDEDMVDNIFKAIQHLLKENDSWGFLEDCLEWLKALKERYTWKPTEQQLYDMEYIMTHYPNIRGMVESIYNKLKKL